MFNLTYIPVYLPIRFVCFFQILYSLNKNQYTIRNKIKKGTEACHCLHHSYIAKNFQKVSIGILNF